MSRTIATTPRFEHLPLTIVAAALLSFAALYITGGQFVGLPIFGLLLIASRFTHRRLPRHPIVIWSIRIVLFFVINALTSSIGIVSRSTIAWYFKPEYTTLGGYLLAGELVLQAWQWRDWTHPREAHGIALLLTALIMAAASNTFRRTPIQIITPPYLLCLLLSFRSFGRPRAALQARSVNRRPVLIGFRVMACIAMLVGGEFLVGAVFRYQDEVNSLILRLAQRHVMRKQEIGLNQTPRLGPVFNPEPSPARVLQVLGRLPDPHLRSMVFDSYRSQTWGPSLAERQHYFSPLTDEQTRAKAVGNWVTFRWLDSGSDMRVAPLNTNGVRSTGAIEMDLEGVMITRGEPSESYQLLLPDDPEAQGLVSVPLNRSRYNWTTFIPPEVDRRVVALARKVSGSGPPLDRARRIADYLRATHGYSLEFHPSGDPLNEFILNNRAAHCEFFATAMTLMARADGIPARYVTGFYAHEFHDGLTVVRSRDAHAWTECWIRGRGWLVFDATPASGLPDRIYPANEPLRVFYEKLSDNFMLLMERLTKISLMDAITWLSSIFAVVALGWGLVMLVIVLLRRSRRGSKSFEPRADLVGRVKRFDRILRQQGIVCVPQRTWRECVSTQAERLPAGGADRLQRFMDAYDHARFGEQKANEELDRLLDGLEGRWTE